MVNVFWLILFAIGTAFVWLREIDGSGVIQTPEAKLVSFIVLLIAFIFPFIFQMIWLIINIVVSHQKKAQIQQKHHSWQKS